MTEPTKIFSGTTAYAYKKSRDLAKYGWRIISEKKWADGKVTLTMKKV